MVLYVIAVEYLLGDSDLLEARVRPGRLSSLADWPSHIAEQPAVIRIRGIVAMARRESACTRREYQLCAAESYAHLNR